MATYEIVVATDILERMSLPQAKEAEAVVERHITTATFVIGGVLETSFAYADKVDRFQINSEVDVPDVYGFYRLRLTQAMVEEDTITVHSSTDISMAGKAAVTTLWHIDRDKGILAVHTDAVDDGVVYFEVTYSAGFSSSNTPPDWLVEAITAYTCDLLGGHKAENTSGDDPSKKTGIQKPKVSPIVEEHLRGRALQIRPYYSA